MLTNGKGNLIRTNEMSIIVARVDSTGHSEGKTEMGERLAENRERERETSRLESFII